MSPRFCRALFVGFCFHVLKLWIHVGGYDSTKDLFNNFTTSGDLAKPLSSPNVSQEDGKDNDHSGVHLVSWNFDYVSPPIEFMIFVLIAGFVKIGFHHMSFLSSIIPESCVLIAVGTAVGSIVHYGLQNSESFRLETRTFMLFLLPPIILESSYSLNDKAFADNLGSILLYAVVGTLLNFVIIGFSMFGLGAAGIMGSVNISQMQYLLFASLIVAVDPVAVLAIFQDIGVNQALYFLVFGESLLNDAVTIVLYNMMKAFNSTPDIQIEEILIGIGSFFTVSIGGLLIGIVYGILTCLITRVTSHVRVTEPLAVLVMAYLSYLSAELFHWSGIISMIGCGIIQAHYAFNNISRKSNITVQYFIKMLSSTTECIVFLFLGLELVRTPYEWNTGFVCSSLLLCLVARLISVFGLTFFVNLSSGNGQIKLTEQFIMWYGGLRGAVCFALCNSVTGDAKIKNMFLTTTFVIIIFTVFIQGTTIKPLVKYCQIVKKHDESEELLIELQNMVMQNIQTNIDVILGQKNNVRMVLHEWNEKYFMRLLQKKTLTDTERFFETYRRIALKRYESILFHGTAEGSITPPAGMMTDGIFSLNTDACNFEEALAEEVQKELHASQRDVRMFQRKPAAEMNKGELYRILSKASLGNPWLHDRDLKYHDVVDAPISALTAQIHEDFRRSLWDMNHGVLPVVDSQPGYDRMNRLSVCSINSDFMPSVYSVNSDLINRPSVYSVNSDVNRPSATSAASATSNLVPQRRSGISLIKDNGALQHCISAMSLSEAQAQLYYGKGSVKNKALHIKIPKRTSSLKEQPSQFPLRFVPGRLRKNSTNQDSVKRLTTLGEEQTEERENSDTPSSMKKLEDVEDKNGGDQFGAYTNRAMLEDKLDDETDSTVVYMDDDDDDDDDINTSL